MTINNSYFGTVSYYKVLISTIHEILEKHQNQPEAPGLVRQTSVTVKAKPKPKPKAPTTPVVMQSETPIQVTREMVVEYVTNERVAKAQRQRQQYSKLASTGLR